MDINELIKEATTTVLETELKPIIREQVKTSVGKAILHAFSGYSKFTEALKAKVEEESQMCLKSLKMTDYNSYIISTINDELEKGRKAAVEPIKEAVAEITGVMDVKEVKMSEIIHQYKLHAMNEACSDENCGDITCNIHYDSEYKWHVVALDIEADTEEYACEFQFNISEKGFIFALRYRDMGESDALRPLTVLRAHGFERWLFSVLNNKCKVIVDKTSFDTEWAKYD